MGVTTLITETEEISVPEGIRSLAAFRAWVLSESVPEKSHIWYLKGEVWVDMSRQQLITHLRVKRAFDRTLVRLAEEGGAGEYFQDGLFLSNPEANIAGNPDGTYFSDESVDAGRIRWVEGADGGLVEVEGTPDMVLEVVSNSSVRKDTVVLFQAYWEAGIPEYWLVDARRDPVRFDIFKYTSKGYVATRKQGGWVKSAVFGVALRLVQQPDKWGRPLYTVEVR